MTLVGLPGYPHWERAIFSLLSEHLGVLLRVFSFYAKLTLLRTLSSGPSAQRGGGHGGHGAGGGVGSGVGGGQGGGSAGGAAKGGGAAANAWHLASSTLVLGKLEWVGLVKECKLWSKKLGSERTLRQLTRSPAPGATVTFPEFLAGLVKLSFWRANANLDEGDVRGPTHQPDGRHQSTTSPPVHAPVHHQFTTTHQSMHQSAISPPVRPLGCLSLVSARSLACRARSLPARSLPPLHCARPLTPRGCSQKHTVSVCVCVRARACAD